MDGGTTRRGATSQDATGDYATTDSALCATGCMYKKSNQGDDECKESNQGDDEVQLECDETELKKNKWVWKLMEQIAWTSWLRMTSSHLRRVRTIMMVWNGST